jgi:4-coumarate--CoA ligase
VADCAVIGVEDDDAGEVPTAFVVPAGDKIDPDALIDFVAGQVAPYKCIRATHPPIRGTWRPPDRKA